MTEASTVIKAAPAKGYARLSPQIRARLADVATFAAWVLVAPQAFLSVDTVDSWIRRPVLVASAVLLVVAWVMHRKKGVRANPVVQGGLLFALIGVSILCMAMYHVSGWCTLAGFASFVAAFALRGSVDRAVIRGRDLQVGKHTGVSWVFAQAESLAAALVMVLLVWHFGLEAFRIPSGSMAPTLLGDPVLGDRVLVDKFVYFYRDPARWEPIVFRYPLRRTDPYVKRCVALPGEQVLIAEGDVYVRLPGTGEIELLRKPPRQREVLWFPIIESLSSNTAWVKNFDRVGKVEFSDGLISVGGGGSIVFPRGETSDKPGNITDHDASFGATETPKDRYGHHVVGDMRLRAELTLDAGGECTIVLVRNDDRYRLELRPDAGGCKLFHVSGDSDEELSIDKLSAIEFGTDARDVAYSLADGELVLTIDGAEQLRLDVGTPLLDQLRARDKQGAINLAGNVALELAEAEPGDGRKARIEIACGEGKGARLRVRSIDRDVYYIGRIEEWTDDQRELPFQVELGEDQYLALGDNSPGSADCRYWTRITLFLDDGTEIVGSMDEPSQPDLVHLLAKAAGEGDTLNAYFRLRSVAHFRQEERPDDSTDAELVANALTSLMAAGKSQGRAAISFYTEGGGLTRVQLDQIKHLQVERLPYVERKLFVGRPFAVFLSPRGMKLID
ncbi:MAG: signal peptidase I [Planctomycetes bacterium]|nr:signal peptidase I [Planctomycetota bacterium]